MPVYNKILKNSLLITLTRIIWGIGIICYGVLSPQDYLILRYITITIGLCLLAPRILPFVIALFFGTIFFGVWGLILFLFIKKYYLFSYILTLFFSIFCGSLLRPQRGHRDLGLLIHLQLVKIGHKVLLPKSEVIFGIPSVKKQSTNPKHNNKTVSIKERIKTFQRKSPKTTNQKLKRNKKIACFDEQKLQKMKNRYPDFFENQPKIEQKPNALHNSATAQTQILSESKNLRKGKVQIVAKKQFDPKYKKTKTNRFIEEHQRFSIKSAFSKIANYLTGRKEEVVFIVAFFLQFWFLSYSPPHFYFKTTKAQNKKHRNTETEQSHKVENFHYQSGLKYFAQLNFKKAERSYNKAIEQNPQEPLFYIARANLYDHLSGKQNNVRAEQDYNQAISLSPEKAEFYALRASFYEKRSFLNFEKQKKAIKDYSKAIALQMNTIDVYYKRAQLYFSLEKYDLALQDCKKIRINFKNTATFNKIKNKIQKMIHLSLDQKKKK